MFFLVSTSPQFHLVPEAERFCRSDRDVWQGLRGGTTCTLLLSSVWLRLRFGTGKLKTRHLWTISDSFLNWRLKSTMPLGCFNFSLVYYFLRLKCLLLLNHISTWRQTREGVKVNCYINTQVIPHTEVNLLNRIPLLKCMVSGRLAFKLNVFLTASSNDFYSSFDTMRPI